MNAFVHTLMYAYYWKPGLFRPLRRLITQLQIAQHVIVLLSIGYTSYEAYSSGTCDVTLLGNGLSLLLYGMYLAQFCAFYARSYLRSRSAPAPAPAPTPKQADGPQAAGGSPQRVVGSAVRRTRSVKSH